MSEELEKQEPEKQFTAQQIFHLFETAHGGRPAGSLEELETWIASDTGKRALAALALRAQDGHIMNDQEIANAYRLRQAQRILDIFAATNGRPARTLEELEKWSTTPEGQAALAVNSDPETGFINPTNI